MGERVSGSGAKKGARYRRHISKDLKDMRLVYENPGAEGLTESQKKLQTLYNENFKAFLERKDKLEAKYGEREGSGERDVSLDRALAAAKEWLEGVR